MINMEFFYLANEQAKCINAMEDYLFGGFALMAVVSFTFWQSV